MVSRFYRGHDVVRIRNKYVCIFCGWKWKNKPASRCPGLPRYDWEGALAADLATEGALAGDGLMVAPGQKPAGVALSGYKGRYYPLYRRCEAVATRAMSPATRQAVLAKQEQARQAVTCVDCEQQFPYKHELDEDGRCEECALRAMAAAARLEAETALRALAAADDWLLVAFEATGWDESSQIVEIGIVDAAGGLVMDQLVRPEGRPHYASQRLTGVSTEEVVAAPPFPALYEELARLLQGRQLLAYGAPLAAMVLRYTCARHGLPPIEAEWTCVRGMFAPYGGRWSERWENFRYVPLVEACAAMGVRPERGWGRYAAADAVATWRLLQKFRE